jgi:hypothetical protein
MVDDNVSLFTSLLFLSPELSNSINSFVVVHSSSEIVFPFLHLVSVISFELYQGERTAHRSVSEEKSLSGSIQENFWKDFSRFKERMASCKLPVTSVQVDDPKSSKEITDTRFLLRYTSVSSSFSLIERCINS